MSSDAVELHHKAQRLFTGVLLLLLVDVIWVASSELTKYVFDDLHYEKPFFSTYFKTTLFAIYLFGFLIYPPWRQECQREASNVMINMGSNNAYQRVDVRPPEDEADAMSEESESRDGPSSSDEGFRRSRLFRSLSSPSFVPANIPDSGKSSGTEESDAESIHSNRRVRFKKLAEVVEMNPAEAMAANLARLSYNASLRAQAALRRAAQRLSVGTVAQLALFFCFPWFMGNFSYQTALAKTEAGVVNALSSSSSLMTLLLAAIFPSDQSDKLTLSKLCGVSFSICGVILVCYSDIHIEDDKIPKGAVWALSGAFFYSLYIVLLRRKVNHEDNMDVPMFFGFVGLFNAALMWPGFLICHFTASEKFELPSGKQWEFLILNGVIGTVFSEILWIWGSFYTSSLIATLAIGLTIPMSIIADILWRGQQFETLFIIGVIPMFCSFFVITMLTHYEDWDPVMDLIHFIRQRITDIFCGAERSTSRYVFDAQERELLINQDSNSTAQEA